MRCTRARHRPLPPDALTFTTYNAALNGTSVEVGVCSWADAESVSSRAPWDLVLGADVLYPHADLTDLADLLPRLVTAGGEVWLADPGRPPAAAFVASCTRWAESSGAHQDDAGVTVHRLRALDRRVEERKRR